MGIWLGELIGTTRKARGQDQTLADLRKRNRRWARLIRNLRRISGCGPRRTGELAIEQIHDVPVRVWHGKAWAVLPSEPQLDSDGCQKCDVNGRPAYSKILEWRNREVSARWSAAVVDLVRRAHPDALDGGGDDRIR